MSVHSLRSLIESWKISSDRCPFTVWKESARPNTSSKKRSRRDNNQDVEKMHLTRNPVVGGVPARYRTADLAGAAYGQESVLGPNTVPEVFSYPHLGFTVPPSKVVTLSHILWKVSFSSLDSVISPLPNNGLRKSASNRHCDSPQNRIR